MARATRPTTKAATARARPARAGSASGDVLGPLALNRALLARQMLLRRATLSTDETLEHLVGMQAQAPNAPYVGLWSRLREFRPDALARLLTDRKAVRMPLIRTTLHLVTARDGLALRPLVQTVLARGFASNFGRNLAGVDMEALLAAGRALVEEQPRTRSQLGSLLGQRWPDCDTLSLAQAVTYLLPLVQVPPRGIWGASGPAAWTTVESWLGRSLDADPSLDEMVLRYLGAFGPASVKDIQTWCWLTRLREVVERLRPRLRTFRDERGIELFDLPDAPRPSPETSAPPRFLPEYDNVLLSHADRTRIMPINRLVPLPPGNGGVQGSVLLDGFFRASWNMRRASGTATLHIESFEPLATAERDALAEEGTQLLSFVAPDAGSQEIRFAEAV